MNKWLRYKKFKNFPHEVLWIFTQIHFSKTSTPKIKFIHTVKLGYKKTGHDWMNFFIITRVC